MHTHRSRRHRTNCAALQFEHIGVYGHRHIPKRAKSRCRDRTRRRNNNNDDEEKEDDDEDDKVIVVLAFRR